MSRGPVEVFVPGRLCLLGEHSDWAGGYRTVAPGLAPGRCLVTATDQGLRALVEPLPASFEMDTVLADGTRQGAVRIPALLGALRAAARGGGFFSYAAGAAAEVRERYAVGGIRIRVTHADLPVGKGLSSSASACVLVVRAYSVAYGLRLSPEDEMALAYEGERRAGSACGRMDQVSALGRRTVLLTFDGPHVGFEPIAVGGPLWLLIVDLGRGKDTRRILTDLNACYPDAAGAAAARVRDALGARNVDLVAAGAAAIATGDAAGLGAVMNEAQRLFDRDVAPVCPELAAPRLHEILAHPAVRELAWGGKGVGSQGDGSAQLLARGPTERDALATRLTTEFDVTTLPLTMEPDHRS